jgi:hypothetical protein
LNNTNRIQEENSTPQQASKNPISEDESPSMQKEASLEEKLDERAINLNELFPEAETDLNNLFPDDKIRHLLKNIIKNKKDMDLIKERLSTENKISKNKEKKITKQSSEAYKA